MTHHDGDTDVIRLPEEERGLERYKYRVYKNNDPQGIHDLCDFFVLDLKHDPAAYAALQAYREAIKDEKPQLARDLDRLIEENYCNCLLSDHPGHVDGCPTLRRVKVTWED